MSIFSKVRMKRPSRNKFNLSHRKILSCKAGQIIPIALFEIMPGDKFRVSSECMTRFAPMLAPIMHMVDVKIDWFFEPRRLTWTGWEEFITKGAEGTSAPVPPYIRTNLTGAGAGKFFVGSLADYYGLPVAAGTISVDQNISADPFRGYCHIWNEYYRDQNVQDPIEFSLGGGDVTSEHDSLMQIRRSAWGKDRFKSALPWPQRGPEVLIPMEGTATVTYKDQTDIVESNSGNAFAPGLNLQTSDLGNAGKIQIDGVADPDNIARVENLEAVEFQNTSVTIRAFRLAQRLQTWFEKNAVGGSRYIEQIYSHFGVKSSDARLQRPEYLGGSRMHAVISEVLSTAQVSSSGEEAIESPPQGNMAGHGISVGKGYGFKRFFEEHGFVHGFLRIMPKPGYSSQGIDRLWSRFDAFDFPWPELAHIGEQEIRDKELYVNLQDPAWTDGVFGYQSRYHEFKSIPSSVHGAMRDSLNYWHWNELFTDKPQLNETFIECNPDKRIFAVNDPSVEDFYVQIFHKVDALRPLPYFGTPSL